jgi:olfactory receptor
MYTGNASAPQIFILLGFSNHPWLQTSLFIMVLVAYVCTLVGNTSIVVAIE